MNDRERLEAALDDFEKWGRQHVSRSGDVIAAVIRERLTALNELETGMKVDWCEVHRAAFEPLDPNPAATPGVCIIESEFGSDDPANCRIVEMGLHPEPDREAYRQGVIDGMTSGTDPANGTE